MSKTRELIIDSTLWATPTRLINLLDFIPSKLNIQTQSNTKDDINVHYVEYDNGGFYLVIDNLKGYFDFSHNEGHLNMLFTNRDQELKYHQVWKEIIKLINGGIGQIKDSAQIRLYSKDDLPLGYVFKIHSVTIVLRSVVKKDNNFYPQIALNYCSYEV